MRVSGGLGASKHVSSQPLSITLYSYKYGMHGTLYVENPYYMKVQILNSCFVKGTYSKQKLGGQPPLLEVYFVFGRRNFLLLLHSNDGCCMYTSPADIKCSLCH